MRHRGCIGKAIAEVEPGRVAGLAAVAAVGFERDAGLAFVGAEQPKRRVVQEAFDKGPVETASANRDRGFEEA